MGQTNLFAKSLNYQSRTTPPPDLSVFVLFFFSKQRWWRCLIPSQEKFRLKHTHMQTNIKKISLFTPNNIKMDPCSFSHRASSTLCFKQLQINYDRNLGNLIVHVLQARNLAPRDNDGYSDPFVKVYLLPGRGWAFSILVLTNMCSVSAFLPLCLFCFLSPWFFFPDFVLTLLYPTD